MLPKSFWRKECLALSATLCSRCHGCIENDADRVTFGNTPGVTDSVQFRRSDGASPWIALLSFLDFLIIPYIFQRLPQGVLDFSRQHLLNNISKTILVDSIPSVLNLIPSFQFKSHLASSSLHQFQSFQSAIYLLIVPSILPPLSVFFYELETTCLVSIYPCWFPG